tara:strand:+ start:318 stop:887 length:570 start_codon:yes stop_codon:yes gene_type:complete
MKKAINKKDIVRIRKPKLEEKAIIMADNGICSLDSNAGVMGIQLHFIGEAQITPELPEGWILQGNNNIMLMFTLKNNPIGKQTLFRYKGYIKIVKAIISNDKGEQLSEIIKEVNSNWTSQKFDFSLDTTSWEDYKDTKRAGKVNITSYNLPDYNLPKLKKKKKKTKIRANKTKPTYTSSGGSSGGSGGY